MNDRLLPGAGAAAETRIDLEEWESEGGASASTVRVHPTDSAASPAVEAVLLKLLGAALVREWNNFPMPLQRAVYGRAVGGNLSRGRSTLKRQMARFLHDHKDPGLR